jgi:hypothetical protein
VVTWLAPLRRAPAEPRRLRSGQGVVPPRTGRSVTVAARIGTPHPHRIPAPNASETVRSSALACRLAPADCRFPLRPKAAL